MVVIPSWQWVQQSTATNPSGHRHELNSSFGFIKTLGTTASNQLDLGAINTTISGGISTTKCIYGRVSSYGDASGVFNMRFFLRNIASWGEGNYRFLEKKSLDFIPNFQLTLGDSDTPTSLPAAQNFKSTRKFPELQFGDNVLSGVLDRDVTQYVYVATFADVDVPVGSYGGGGSNGFRYTCAFDFS